jgi:stage V sporulation protein G
MKITQVSTYKVESDSKVVGLASITLDDCLVVSDLKIMQGSNGLFVSMPNRKNQKGEYKDIVFPITKEFRQELQKAILDKFNGTSKNTIENTGDYVTIDDTADLPF